MALAVLATTLAALRPALAIAQVPTVSALAGQPPPPRAARRLAGPVASDCSSWRSSSWAWPASRQPQPQPKAATSPPHCSSSSAASLLCAPAWRSSPRPSSACSTAPPDAPDRPTAGRSRPGPLSGTLRCRARCDQHQSAHRCHHLRGRRRPVRQRPRLRRAQPGRQPAHPLHPQRPRRRAPSGSPGAHSCAARGDAGRGQRHRSVPRILRSRRTRDNRLHVAARGVGSELERRPLRRHSGLLRIYAITAAQASPTPTCLPCDRAWRD